MQKRRLFIAINLPEEIKRKLMEYRRKWFDLDAQKINWVRKENLHITLIFIGYATDDETYEIAKSMKQVARKHEPFSINLEKIITGPAYDKSSAGKPPTPRMFWVEGEKSQELADLQNDLNREIQQLSGAKYSAYRPHITLARFKYDVAKKIKEMEGDIEEKINYQIPVDAIQLMQSDLHRSGPIYTILENVELGI